MLEIFSVICGLIQSILILMKKKENWIFYILNISSLILFSFYNKLYGDVLENTIYLLFGMLGLFTWYSVNIKNKLMSKHDKIKYCTNKERLFYITLFIFENIIVYIWLSNTDDVFPVLDTITTALGLVATLMMALKKVDAWLVWFVDDILMAIIYFILPERAVYLMILNIVWIFLAIGTWYTWHKETKESV